MGRIAVAEDVMRHPLRNLRCVREREDGEAEIADVCLRFAAALTFIGATVVAREKPESLRVVLLQTEEHRPIGSISGILSSVVNSGRHELQPHAADC
jgi:hypothetical protein